MESVQQLVIRYLTDADFFNIKKPPGTESSGGGQTYIDFPTSEVSLEKWKAFFENGNDVVESQRSNGPSWTFPIASIGLGTKQDLTIYQRRPQSVSIAAQRLPGTSSGANRVHAWLPENGFPTPDDPTDRDSVPDGLAIYLVRTHDGEYLAGWFMDRAPCKDSITRALLAKIIDSNEHGSADILEFEKDALFVDVQDKSSPFTVSKDLVGSVGIEPLPPVAIPLAPPAKPNEDTSFEQHFLEDVGKLHPKQLRRVTKTYQRDKRAVKILKDLYAGECQITGRDLAFKKKDGTYYSEVHHLVPLGEEGSDLPQNMVNISPLIHRMLHYADVSPIDLSKIREDNTLPVTINGKEYTIKWHSKHADTIRETDQP